MGMRNAKAMQRAGEQAESPLSTGQALDALSSIMGEVLFGGAANRRFAVCRVDWSRSPWQTSPLVSRLLSREGIEPVEILKAESQGERHSELLQRRPESAIDPKADPVRAFLGRTVRHWEDDAELASLGFDSLDFVQLRNGFIKQFGTQVPLSAFAAPNRTLGELAAHLSAVVTHQQIS